VNPQIVLFTIKTVPFFEVVVITWKLTSMGRITLAWRNLAVVNEKFNMFHFSFMLQEQAGLLLRGAANRNALLQ